KSQQERPALPVLDEATGIEPLVDEEARLGKINLARHRPDRQAPDPAFFPDARATEFWRVAAEDKMVLPLDLDDLKHLEMGKAGARGAKCGLDGPIVEIRRSSIAHDTPIGLRAG